MCLFSSCFQITLSSYFSIVFSAANEGGWVQCYSWLYCEKSNVRGGRVRLPVSFWSDDVSPEGVAWNLFSTSSNKAMHFSERLVWLCLFCHFVAGIFTWWEGKNILSPFFRVWHQHVFTKADSFSFDSWVPIAHSNLSCCGIFREDGGGFGPNSIIGGLLN